VASRPLRVEELAEFLAFDFKAEQIPTFREDWRLEDPVEAVLSTCSTLFSIVNVKKSQVIQFSHFSVKEFLTSVRFGEKRTTISSRYHVSMIPAHTLVAQACLGILLHLDKNLTTVTLLKFPLAEYAAEHWFEHARFEAVSQRVEEGMKQLFDPGKPHFAAWLWICEPTFLPMRLKRTFKAPSTLSETPLHYAAFCGLSDVIEFLVIEHSQDVNSRNFIGGETPLHLNSRVGYVDVARLLIELGADLAAQGERGSTPLHRASEWGHADLARFLIEHGADVAAQDRDGPTPLHRASSRGHVNVARLLMEYGADAASQDEHGRTPLHPPSSGGYFTSNADLVRLLVEHGADAAAQDEHGWTPLHEASSRGDVGLAQLLIECGANAAVQDKHRSTPLHRASA
jgi:ankyrin repeat protein